MSYQDVCRSRQSPARSLLQSCHVQAVGAARRVAKTAAERAAKWLPTVHDRGNSRASARLSIRGTAVPVNTSPDLAPQTRRRPVTGRQGTTVQPSTARAAERAGRGALLLAGSIGMGHNTLAEACAETLEADGWYTQTLDLMQLLGRGGGSVGKAVFRSMLAVP